MNALGGEIYDLNVPNYQSAEIHPDKITKYLLAESHVDGGDKAERFDQVGFRLTEWKELAVALHVHIANNNVVRIDNTEYGTKYIVDGWLEAPRGRPVYVRAVWQIDRGSNHPRLISAYPFGR